MYFNYKSAYLSVISGLVLLGSLPPLSALAAETGETTQSLQEQLDATRDGFAKRMPPEVIRNIEEAVRDVADTGILDQALKAGDRAPDFILPDATGANVKLSSLLREGPVVLTWYRGNW